MIILYTEWVASEGNDCETCGYHQDHGYDWSLDGSVFYSESSTGCYGGSGEDETFLEKLIPVLVERLLGYILSDEDYRYVFHSDTSKEYIESDIKKVLWSVNNLELCENEDGVEVLKIVLRSHYYVELGFRK